MVGRTRKENEVMQDEVKAVTPAEESEEQPSETADEETVTPTEESPKDDTETPEPEQEENQEDDGSSEVDDKATIAELKRDIEQLKSHIRAQGEDEDETNTTDEIKLPADVKDFLTEFAENPHETLKKVIKSEVKPYEGVLKEVQQQQAIDYVRSQKDFSEKMYDDLLYIVQGPERNRMFDVAGVTVKLKDLPPRQKAEAALQIYRAHKTKQDIKPPARPKPVTTTKTKSTQKSSAKPDELLSAADFAKKHGIKQGAL